jgi:4-hydroxy-tetrahydrodipicolinate synthase
MDWHGVFPAITTPFTRELALDERALARHVTWMVQRGARAIVPLGSLGEGNTLSFEEKLRAIDVCREAAGLIPVVPGIAALSTAEAVSLIRAAGKRGCAGAMVLPPYVYRGDERETLAHFDAVFGATPLPCMLYNNPLAYGTDVLPAQLAALAERHRNLVAVKESSADIRRITALRVLLAERLVLFVGVDDMILEGLDAGAVGWIAGQRLPERDGRVVRPDRQWRAGRGAPPLRVVPAVAAARHGAQVRPAHQARAGRGRQGQ